MKKVKEAGGLPPGFLGGDKNKKKISITLKRRKNFFSKVIIMDCGMDCNQIMNIFSKS